jgi:hypothetical protein
MENFTDIRSIFGSSMNDKLRRKVFKFIGVLLRGKLWEYISRRKMSTHAAVTALLFVTRATGPSA